MKINKIFVMLIVLSLVMTACTNTKEKTITRDTFMLDTLITITLYGTDSQEIMDGAIDLIGELESTLSVHKEDSDLYNIRQNAGKTETKVSEHTINILKRSMQYYELTEEDYDVTLGPLIELWNKYKELEEVPTKGEVSELLMYIGMNRIKINEDNNTVFVEDGMFLDFGACAKGYIADKVKEYLINKGVQRATINLGGNVNIIGSKIDGKDFNIGMRSPDDALGEGYFGVLKLSDTSVVTSGDYERYYEVDGVRYHHILDPKTGYPADSDIKSVSIITKDSLNADILSTSVFVLGFDKGRELINELNEVEAIFVLKNNTVYVTDGIKDSFELSNQSYKIIN